MSLLRKLVFNVVFASILDVSFTTSPDNRNYTTYDQRQTGDLNIHISVKDLSIVAVLGNGALGGSQDYDYNYDYSELTVKPPNGHNTTTSTTTVAATTKKDMENVLTTTEKVVEITPPSPIVQHHKLNTTVLRPTPKDNSTNLNGTVLTTQMPEGIIHSNNNTTDIPVQILTTPVEIVYIHKDGINSTTLKPHADVTTASGTSGEKLPQPIKQANCIEGYRKDNRGICRPRPKRPTQQTLLRKLIQLSHQLQPNNKKASNPQN